MLSGLGITVAVYRGNAQLGYVPRGENSTVAGMMDRGDWTGTNPASHHVPSGPNG